MIRSLARRILYIILLLWIISLVTFWLSKAIPGDAVMDYISIDQRGFGGSLDPVASRQMYERVAVQRGLNLPSFYFSVIPAYYHDSLSHVVSVTERNTIRSWTRSSGDGDGSYRLHQELLLGLQGFCTNKATRNTNVDPCTFYAHSLNEKNLQQIHTNANALINAVKNDSILNTSHESLNQVSSLTSQLLEKKKIGFTGIMPQWQWHGTQNQYHQWISGLFLQKPLTSLVDGRNAWDKLYDALRWTIWLNGLAFILCLVFGVIIGIWSGTRSGTWSEKTVNWVLFALFALPSFWLGTLLIYFFASGEWVSWFPAGGLGSYQVADTWIERWWIIAIHLFLPIICLAVGPLAYISRQMKQSVIHEIQQPYVTSLRALGISEKTILRKHVIRNALFPLITIIGGSIPALLSGSLVIEVIFSIPGMGRLLYNSLLSRDWPVAFPILILGAAITVFAYVLTDIIYKWADPRVKVLQS